MTAPTRRTVLGFLAAALALLTVPELATAAAPAPAQAPAPVVTAAPEAAPTPKLGDPGFVRFILDRIDDLHRGGSSARQAAPTSASPGATP